MTANGETETGSQDIEDVYPLTPMQNGILFHTLKTDHSGPYIEQFLFDVSVALDRDRFIRSWRIVLDRHTALRSAVVWEGVDEPLQIVMRDAAVSMSEVDTTGWASERFDEEVRTWLDADRARGIPLSEAPLMRLTLLPRPAGGGVLVWTLHHLVMDGWSMPITVQEVATVYRALGDGGTGAELLPAAKPFRDFVAWLQGATTVGAERFWRDRLAGMVRTPIPAPRPGHVEAGTAAGGRAYLDLGPDLSRSILAAAQTAKVTVNTVYQAGWALMLARLAGTTDVVFGTTVSGRPAALEGVEQMVGLFINTIAHRVRLPGGQSARQWLAELAQRHLDTLAHQHVALPLLQSWTDVPPGEAMFDSIVVFENYPSENPHFDLGEGATLRIREVIEDAGYPLTLTVLPRAGGTRLQLLYDQGRYSDGAAGRLLAAYAAALQAIAGGLDTNVADLVPTLSTPAAPVRVAQPPTSAPAPATGAAGFFTDAPDAEAMRLLWSEVLGREVTDPDSDFFRLGGDSLAAVRLVGRLRTVLQSQVGVSALFEERTLRALLQRVHRLAGAEAAGGVVTATRATTANDREGSC
ncbi:condensation domain-containing protein [Mangrovihabitans endophyticus]|uniref:Carrier domain-containing protein n=1 Tax=Mangrovihabitans endophyticus TaxID=1751298 RepID=A0A8J3FKF3_9ACTN|nr:condensation domain-containing protein [Mangrovihabitans endophyticus]GGK72664.1 hypothetical protein GCM10012284_03110 [Mangrovihabitans endophyticus]